MAIKTKNFWINNDGQTIDMIINFLNHLPKTENPIYWGTFNVSLTKGNESSKMIDKIKTACGDNQLRVICESPDNQNAPFNKRSLITKDAFDLLQKNGIEIKYFSNQDDENSTQIDRVHHAKYLIFENNLLIGSFNLSHQSLHGNVESLVWLEGEEVEDIYESFSTKWDDGVFKDIDPNKLTEQRLPKKDQAIIYEGPVDFEKIYASVFGKLYDHQKEILRKLFDRNFQEDILSLPTGLGKTFIGIAWLLKQAQNVGDEAKLLIITPNRLITETIKNICEKELKMPELVSVIDRKRAAINIKRAVDFLDEDQGDDFSAVVFDEVHNWSKDELNEYNRAQKILRKNKSIKILGISATPSRHPNYDQDYFYRAFCDQQDGSPLSEYTAIYAIAQEWLARPEWKVVSNSCDKLKHYTPIKGKYTEGKLMREWWNTLTADDDLVEKIIAEIKENGLKKGLLYMPPVGEELLNFVTDFREGLSGYGDVLDIRAGTCCNPEKEIKKFRHAKDPVFLVSINRASEGISIPEIDSLIMLRMPLSDNLAIQMIGRGLRRHKQKERLVVLDAVGYQKRLILIPAWGQAAAKQIRESKEAPIEIEVKSAEVKAKTDPRIKRFVDLVAECRREDLCYVYDFFLKKHVGYLLEKKDFDRLVCDGLSGDLKKDFGSVIGVKVYGNNSQRSKKILLELVSIDNSNKILGNYINNNKNAFANRYMREIDRQIYDKHLDENYYLNLAKENVGEMSCEEIIDHFYVYASREMRKSLLAVAFEYEMDYIRTIIHGRAAFKRALIEYLDRFAALD